MQLNEQQRLIRDSVCEIARSELAPYSAAWDRQQTFPKAALGKLAELGLFGMLVDEQWDGAGADMRSLALAIEEIAAADAACSTIISVTNSVVCGPIEKFGSEQQKHHYLKPLARGDYLGCFCLTEAQAGSDAAAIQCRATAMSIDGEQYYEINGDKQFITSGKNADIAIVFAVTDASAGKRGISAFIVPTDTQGYEVVRTEDKLGQRASDTAQLRFTQCRIPAANRLAEEGMGYKIALSNLQTGRIGIAAQSVGMARAAYDNAAAYARERQSFGRPIIEHQAVGFRLADMLSQLNAARLLVWQAASQFDAGEDSLQAACIAKLFASEAAEKIASDAIQTLGGYGYINDYPLAQIYRDVKVTTIYEGSSDIQRMLIARSIAQAD